MRIYLNNDWLFTEQYSEEFMRGDLQEGKTVRIPHTVKETPYDYFDESVYQMISGYRRELPVDASMKDKSLVLHFEAVGHGAEVFLNGEKIAEHSCGYTAFEADISDKVNFGGKNMICVRCDSRETQDFPPFGFVIDYMTYGGIYRDVWLEVREKTYIKDLFLKPVAMIIPRSNKVTIGNEITLAGVESADGYTLRQTVTPHGREGMSTVTEIALGKCEKKERQENVFLFDSFKENADLWSPDHPYLYDVKTELIYMGEVRDIYEVRTGFRNVLFNANGLYINGKKVKIRGLNRHQSYPYVGYAMPDSQQIADADILKYELGLNAVRTSHYPQSHAFIGRCDEIGLLVFTEIPGWQHVGEGPWKDQAVKNTEDMVLQYRNHPSIFLWGVRINESNDDDELYLRTNLVARALDPTRPTGGVRCIKKSNLLEDVYTYNDFLHDGTNKGCDRKKDVTSDMSKGYMVTEYNGHMYPTKTYDSELHRMNHMIRHAAVLDAVAAEDDIAGSFGWCMADYNTHRDFGSGDRICYHGVLDMFRNPKLAAAVYAAYQKDTPVLEVSSQMDIGEHPTGNIGEVYAVTNAEKIRFYKNGKFVRDYYPSESKFAHLPSGPVLIDDFIGDQLVEKEGFKPKQAELAKDILNYAAIHGFNSLPASIMAKAGTLMALYGMKYEDAYALYSKYIGNWGDSTAEYKFEAVNGDEVVKTVIRSAATELHLEASADHTELVEGKTYDVASVRISVKDQNGNVLPFFQGPIAVKVTGPAEIIGPKIISMRGGLGGTYIRTTGEEGEISLSLGGDQVQKIQLVFRVIKEK